MRDEDIALRNLAAKLLESLKMLKLEGNPDLTESERSYKKAEIAKTIAYLFKISTYLEKDIITRSLNEKRAVDQTIQKGLASHQLTIIDLKAIFPSEGEALSIDSLVNGNNQKIHEGARHSKSIAKPLFQGKANGSAPSNSEKRNGIQGRVHQ